MPRACEAWVNEDDVYSTVDLPSYRSVLEKKTPALKNCLSARPILVSDTSAVSAQASWCSR